MECQRLWQLQLGLHVAQRILLHAALRGHHLGQVRRAPYGRCFLLVHGRRCRHQVSEGKDGGKEACQGGVYAVLVDHERRGVFQEGKDGGVEAEAKQSDEPESLTTEDDSEVSEFEGFVIVSRCNRGCAFLLIQTAVHHAEHEVGHQAYEQQYPRQEQ